MLRRSAFGDRFIYTIDLILMTCKHQLVKNTLCYVERALSGRVERIPPQDQLVIELAAKPAEKSKSGASKKPSGPNVEGQVSNHIRPAVILHIQPIVAGLD